MYNAILSVYENIEIIRCVESRYQHRLEKPRPGCIAHYWSQCSYLEHGRSKRHWQREQKVASSDLGR